jgi:hypothetical protein
MADAWQVTNVCNSPETACLVAGVGPGEADIGAEPTAGALPPKSAPGHSDANPESDHFPPDPATSTQNASTVVRAIAGEAWRRAWSLAELGCSEPTAQAGSSRDSIS